MLKLAQLYTAIALLNMSKLNAERRIIHKWNFIEDLFQEVFLLCWC